MSTSIIPPGFTTTPATCRINPKRNRKQEGNSREIEIEIEIEIDRDR